MLDGKTTLAGMWAIDMASQRDSWDKIKDYPILYPLCKFQRSSFNNLNIMVLR